MDFTFEVNVSVERDEGKFASRDELAEQIQEALESADPSSLSGENGGNYSVIEWSVSEVDLKARKVVQKPNKLPVEG